MSQPTSPSSAPSSPWTAVLHPTVLVAALGYFVDIYDLLLFRIVRDPSLEALGVPLAERTSVGVFLDNMQQVGLLLGGLLWGMWSDRRGRVSVLYASILLYSVANILNSFATTVPVYAALRLLAGLGLAGELGVAITLVSEVLPAKWRGYGTTVVATVGVLGAVVAATVAKATSWQVAYLVGGGLGLSLLAIRVRMADSPLFHAPQTASAPRGSLRLLLGSAERIRRYLACILVAVPIWYVIGILMAYGNKLAPELGVRDPVTTADTILWSYLGLAVGDLSSGLLSQALRSRRRAMAVYLLATAGATAVYLLGTAGWSRGAFLGLCFGLGVGVGYWAMFMQATAEQFGTNLRATATTSASNLVRAAVIPMSLVMKTYAPLWGMPRVVGTIGLVVFALAAWAWASLRETFGRSLDFVEESSGHGATGTKSTAVVE